MDIKTGVHRSEFVDVDGVVGYLNSDSLLPIVHYEKNFLLTLLHGPVLVKNPELADSIISKLGIAVELKSAYLDELDALAKEGRRIAFEH
jgi:CobQ-like glutamine amidotransferase family enzyme